MSSHLTQALFHPSLFILRIRTQYNSSDLPPYALIIKASASPRSILRSDSQGLLSKNVVGHVREYNPSMTHRTKLSIAAASEFSRSPRSVSL